MRVRVDGLREVERNLEQLAKGTGKGALRRALKTAAQPLAEAMRAAAPDDPDTGGDDLKSSITVTSKLSKRQSRFHRRMFRDDRASVEMFVGAGPLPQAHLQEFGTAHHAAQPFARPAWDADQRALLDRLTQQIRIEVDKSIARAAKTGKLLK